MATVSEPRGSSFEEAKLQYDDILVALKQQNGNVTLLELFVTVFVVAVLVMSCRMHALGCLIGRKLD